MAVDIAGFVAELKDHAIEHGFHIHDERHFVETYSLRQAWEIDLHPEEGCGGPIDLHLSLDVDPRVLLQFQDILDAMGPDWEEPGDSFDMSLLFNWGVPPLNQPPDLLILATDLAGVGGPDLPIEVSAIDSFEAVTDAPERRLAMVGTASVSLADLIMGREQMCSTLDRAKDVSMYLLKHTEDWLADTV